MKVNQVGAGLTRILDLLNQALKLEYSSIVYYPWLASASQDEEVKRLALHISSVSINHAVTVASILSQLGGNQHWSFDSPPEHNDLTKMFERQLQEEKLAWELYWQSSSLIEDSSFRVKLIELAKDEVQHIKMVEEILSRLTCPQC